MEDWLKLALIQAEEPNDGLERTVLARALNSASTSTSTSSGVMRELFG